MGVLISFKDGTERTLDDALLAERNNRELSQREPTKLHTPIKFVDGMCPVVFDANDLDAYVAGPDVRRDRKHIVKAQEHNLRILKVRVRLAHAPGPNMRIGGLGVATSLVTNRVPSGLR